MRYLYRLDATEIMNKFEDSYNGIDVKVFTPSIRRGFFLKGEKTGIKTICIRLLFQVMTLGKAQIYYVQVGNDIVHTSYVVPACAKFPFMGRNDLEIGPCYTYPAFRGKGIYPKVLTEICRRRGDVTSSFYMIVHETNYPSIRGIEKAGFIRYGLVCKSKILKRYKLVH